MTVARVCAISKVILFGHVLNPFWLPRDKRRKIRSDVISCVVPCYLKRYLKTVRKVKEQPIVQDDKNEKIWTVWLQGEENAPNLVKACFRSVRKHCSQELVVLDEKTIFDYISLPDVIVEKYRAGKIKNAHFADICRVELLYRYGGYWLDATGFVTAPIPDWISEQDFFIYLTGSSYKISGSPYSFVQNCFIRARKGAYLLAAWRAMIFDYWLHENSVVEYFMHQLMFKTLVINDERAKKYFDKMPHVDQDPTHALWWAYKDRPFSQKLFNEAISGAFFQKTAYKGSDNIIPGSFADEIINKMNMD